MIECVVNISEGTDSAVISAIADAAGADLLDVHTDAFHNRSVLTLVGEDAPRAVTRAAVEAIDLRRHRGVHPRIGAVDVVPFVPLGEATFDDALAARDRFGTWAADEMDLPSFTYGPERSLPEVRKHAFTELEPTFGPTVPHQTAGAVALGARSLLVAYNVWLAEADLDAARAVAREIRGPHLRTLGLPVGDRVQVSTNLISPFDLGPADAFDLVAERVAVAGAELVGLVPSGVLDGVAEARWAELDLARERTIEWRLAKRVGQAPASSAERRANER